MTVKTLSKLQQGIIEALTEAGIPFVHRDGQADTVKITYQTPVRVASYFPTFTIRCNDGVIVVLQQKGRFVTADRQKHIMIKQQHPALDLRFVFSNSRQTISKQSPTTYARWCERHGFAYCDKGAIPAEWLEELKGRTAKAQAA